MAEKKMHGFRARLDYILKHNYTVNRIFNFTASTAMKFIGLFVKMDKEMVIFSGHTRRYNDSPRAIYEYMLTHPEKYGNYKCVWALEDLEFTDIPGNPIKVKSDTLQYFILTLKAKYWVACVNIERSLHYKKKGCRYLNTWHGTPFKCVGNDAGGRKDYDFDTLDYFCYAGKYEGDIFARAFNVRKEVMIPSGLPRNDELYHVTDDEKTLLKQKLGLPLDKKVIMYAPTWRDSVDKGKSCSLCPPVDVAKWEKELGDEYVILFRMHAYTNKLMGLEFNDVIRDFSSYPAINDLFKVADLLISDYSAAIFDYAILERPIVSFAYDYEEYRNLRGLYIDMEKEMPNGICRTEDDVIRHIKTMDYTEECHKTKTMVKAKYLEFGGNATQICVEKLFEK